MTTYDVHQHLWPPAFLDALRARSSPPLLDGDELVTREGRYAIDLGDHDPHARLRALDRDRIDVAVLSLQPSLGLDDLPVEDGERLQSIWVEGIAELTAGSAGRFTAFSPSSYGKASRASRSDRRRSRTSLAQHPCSTLRRPPGPWSSSTPTPARRLMRRDRAGGNGWSATRLACRRRTWPGLPPGETGGRRCGSCSRCSEAVDRFSSSGSPGVVSTSARHLVRTHSSRCPLTDAGRSSSASRPSVSGSWPTAATRPSSTPVRHWMPSAVSVML